MREVETLAACDAGREDGTRACEEENMAVDIVWDVGDRQLVVFIDGGQVSWMVVSDTGGKRGTVSRGTTEVEQG